jgi:hypothetical protein
VDKIEVAPAKYKYWPFYSRLRDILVGRLSTALTIPKLTFTIMPMINKRPRVFKMMITKNFYIIEGQHTYVAIRVILADSNVLDAWKEVLQKWKLELK